MSFPWQDNSSAKREATVDMQMQIQRNRQRCLFTDRALREVRLLVFTSTLFIKGRSASGYFECALGP